MRDEQGDHGIGAVSRRGFLTQAARLSALGKLAAAGALAGCGTSEAPLPAPQGDAQMTLPAFAFSDAQRRALSAAVARLVPAQGAGDWSAVDAGAVGYIEQLLNSFSAGDRPRIYGHGPDRARFGEFQALSRAKAQGWMQDVLRLRAVYAEGLDTLNRLARGPLSVLSGEFADLPALEQDALLVTQDLANTPFFTALFAHTMEGVYSHPVYGGNRDYIGWNAFCYEGDVHGRRYPNGYDPVTDDRPWDRFGGYAPDEMGQPGAGCGGAGLPFTPRTRT